MRPKLEPILKEELDAIHLATLKVLENVGVKFPDETALRILEDYGAKIEYNGQIAYISEAMLKDALKKLPEKPILCARNPKNDIQLAAGQTYFCPSSLGAYMYDLDSGERRTSTTEDLVKFARIEDALRNFHIAQVCVMPCDVPEMLADHYRFEAEFSNTTKHVIHLVAPGTTPEGARDHVRMATCIAGSEDNLRRSPLFSIIEEPISPLQYDANGLRVLMEYARAGIPIMLYDVTLAGATAPVTVAGQLVQKNAEILAGIVLTQATNPGNISVYGSAAGIMDLVTGISSLGALERALISIGVVQLAHYYHIPSIPAAMNTEASLPGSRTVFEKITQTLPVIFAAPDIVLGGGTFDSANTYSIEQLVLDEEMLSGLARILRGFEVNEDTLAVEVIKKVGIGGNFIGERHTLKHVRTEQWFPTLYTRSKEPEKVLDLATIGEKDLIKAARDKAKRILATHQPESLDRDVRKEIAQIITEARKKMSNS